MIKGKTTSITVTPETLPIIRRVKGYRDYRDTKNYTNNEVIIMLCEEELVRIEKSHKAKNIWLTHNQFLELFDILNLGGIDNISNGLIESLNFKKYIGPCCRYCHNFGMVEQKSYCELRGESERIEVKPNHICDNFDNPLFIMDSKEESD